MDSATDENMTPPSHVVAITNGDARLLELGNKQELKRHFSLGSLFLGHLNFRPLVFCFISADWHHQFTTLYNTGLNYGGPVSMQYGWFMALAFTMLVALSMAEICSSIQLLEVSIIGVPNLLALDGHPLLPGLLAGIWAGSTSVNFSLAELIQIIILLSTGGKNGGGYEASKYIMGSATENMTLPSHVVAVTNGIASPLDSGHARLLELGYKQELKRDLLVVSNFSLSFSVISVPSGITTLYNTGLNYGGPVSMQYGWFIVSGFTMLVALSMAEICSSFPTSGGLYYWSAKLGCPRWAPFVSWITATTSVDFLLAQLIHQVIILLSTGGKNGGGYEASKYVVIAFHGGILFLHGVFVLMILISSVATERAGLKFSFTHFNTENEDGIKSKPYIFLLGLLMSQYTLIGYDASAPYEETKGADRNGPKGIISAVGISIIVGWGYIIGIIFAVTNIHYLLSESNDAGGYAIAEMFYLAFKTRYGNGIGGIICLVVVAVSIFFCGLTSELPLNAVWLSVFMSFCKALTLSIPTASHSSSLLTLMQSLGSMVAFEAIVSIAVIVLSHWHSNSHFFLHLLMGSDKILPSHVVANGHAPLDSGHARLKELGYKQELKRDLSVISNFAFSFSIISVLTGVTTLYNTGLNYGGPVSLVYGWFLASAFTMIVALSMAEICSSYPTSGGLYYWSAKLAGPRWAPFASWITGWFNIVGQVIILLSTGGKNGGGYEASKYVVIAFHGGILFLHGVFVLMIVIPSVATERASAKFVFTHFNAENGEGINSKPYIFLLGLLMSQYTLTGFDASAHMTEETKDADRNGPKGIISAVGISIVVGWGYILGITFAVTDILYLLSEDNDAGGYAIAQVFYQAFKKRYGHGTGGIICLVIVAVAIFFCGMSSVTSNSRMAYAFSRDGAMPLSSLWHKVNKQESLGSIVAFEAMVSIATIGLYIAYAFPIFLRVTLARKHFVSGPFNLGRYGVVVGWVAVLWVLTISVLFSLPVSYPITIKTLNYTPVAVGCLLILVVSYWLISGRRWFKGPITNI
ncbi:Amino-acid permease BAT1 [Glycine max]|nr:Amino-acid permease BAT1 [Glycine max]